jgi:hypothetical protein
MYPASPRNPPTLVGDNYNKGATEEAEKIGRGAVSLVCPWEGYFMWIRSKYWALRRSTNCM